MVDRYGFNRSRFLRFVAFFTLIVFLLIGSGCAPRQPSSLLLLERNPYLFDDLHDPALLAALDHHLDALKSKKDDYHLVLGEKDYSKTQLLESLHQFLSLLKSSCTPWELNQKIRQQFDVYQAAGRSPQHGSREMLVTGYFEPVLAGSLARSKTFRFPVYGRPSSLVVRKSYKDAKKRVGRFDQDNSFVPYWTRKEIEEGQYAKGFELVYLQNRLDTFLLHVQGSGKILLENGEIRSIHYAVSNGHEYKSIGKLLVDEGKMTLKEASIPTIRRYLDQHPSEQQRVFHHNPRFIFFQWGKNSHVIGSLGIPLTPGRSVAIDQTCLPAGLPGYLITRQPVLDRKGNIIRWQPMRRIVLPQDSGNAIKGSGRVDLFWGNGQYAEVAAGNMKEKGTLFFVVIK